MCSMFGRGHITIYDQTAKNGDQRNDPAVKNPLHHFQS